MQIPKIPSEELIEKKNTEEQGGSRIERERRENTLNVLDSNVGLFIDEGRECLGFNKI